MKKLLLTIFVYLALAGVADAYKFASGSYEATGVGGTIDISDTSDFNDFQPDACIVKGDASNDGVIRISGMDANESSQLDGSGIITTGITVLTSNGFTIGTSATVTSSCFTNVVQSFDVDGFTYGGNLAVNNNGNAYRWFAIREAAAAPVTRRPVAPIFFP